MDWKVIITAIVFALILWSSWEIAERQEREQELRRQRCINGVYDPCSLNCRSFMGVLTNSDGCDCREKR